MAYQDQFDAAKAYIQQKEYGKARAILLKIEHPQADRWLAKLDELDPSYQKAIGRKRSGKRVMIGCAVFIVIALIAIAAYYSFYLKPQFAIIVTNAVMTARAP